VPAAHGTEMVATRWTNLGNKANRTRSLKEFFKRIRGLDGCPGDDLTEDRLRDVFGDAAEEFLVHCDGITGAECDRTLTVEEFMSGVHYETRQMSDGSFHKVWVERARESLHRAELASRPQPGALKVLSGDGWAEVKKHVRVASHVASAASSLSQQTCEDTRFCKLILSEGITEYCLAEPSDDEEDESD